ncbi:hypothetical protein [Planctomycetes bacterium CA13]|uniref:hypothetical protein n=1 Tax=Novipirellula herctigrandis TaxID=2527986 RepID=UPI0011B36ED8
MTENRFSPLDVPRRVHKTLRRYWLAITISAAFVVLFVGTLFAITPKVISRSSLGPALLSRVLARHGLSIESQYFRIGWTTPLRLSGVRLTGNSGENKYFIGQIDSDLTLAHLIGLSSHSIGAVTIHSVDVHCKIRHDKCTLEDDFGTILNTNKSSLQRPSGHVKIQRIRIHVMDETTGSTWQIAKSKLDITFAGDKIVANASGELSNPSTDDRVIGSFEGSLTITDGTINAKAIRINTDIGSVAFDGSFDRTLTFAGLYSDPINTLETLDGVLALNVDLPMLDAAIPKRFPSLFHLPADSKIKSGHLFATIKSNASQQKEVTLGTSPIIIRSFDADVAIEPLDIQATVVHDEHAWTCDQFRLESQFVNATGAGSPTHGSAKLQLNLDRIATMLRPITRLSNNSLSGAIDGNFAWHETGQDQWQWTGEATATNFHLQLDDEQPINQKQAKWNVDLCGRFRDQVMVELRDANVTFRGDDLNLQAQLVRPVSHPTQVSHFPLQIEASGGLEPLEHLLKRTVLEQSILSELHDATGTFTAVVQGEFGRSSGRLDKATIELADVGIVYKDRSLSDPNIKIAFDGNFTWPSGDWKATGCTIRGDSISASIRGQADQQDLDLVVDWQCKLDGDQLKPTEPKHEATTKSWQSQQPTRWYRPVGYRFTQKHAIHNQHIEGDFGGKVKVKRIGNKIVYDTEISGRDVSLVESSHGRSDAAVATSIASHHREPTPGRIIARAVSDSPKERIVWSEPVLKIEGVIQYDPTTHCAIAKKVQIAGHWFSSTLTGKANWKNQDANMELNGPARLDMHQLGQRLSRLAGTPIEITGIHQAPITLNLQRTAGGSVGFDLSGELKWEAITSSGIKIGAAAIPFRMSESRIKIASTKLQVDDSQFTIGAEVCYRPGPVIVRLDPGVVSESMKLSDETSQRLLKFIAPPVSRVDSVDGCFGFELDEATINLDKPERSRVVGRLVIERANISLSPMAKQIMEVAKKVQAIARDHELPTTGLSQDLVTLPKQMVEFDLDFAVLHNQGVKINIGDTSVVTRGGVRLDGQLNMIAKVPRTALALSRNVDAHEREHAHASDFIYLPISGTIYNPVISPTGVSNVAAILSNRALFEATEH